MFFTKIPRLFPQDFHRGNFGASGRKDGKIWKKGLIFGGRAGIIRLSTLFLERFFDFFLYREAALFFCSFFFTAAAVCFSTAHRRLKAVVFSLREGYNSFRTRGPFPNARRGCAPSSALLPLARGRTSGAPLGSKSADLAPAPRSGGFAPRSKSADLAPAPTRRALRPSTPGDFPVAGKVTKGAPRATPFGIPLGFSKTLGT